MRVFFATFSMHRVGIGVGLTKKHHRSLVALAWAPFEPQNPGMNAENANLSRTSWPSFLPVFRVGYIAWVGWIICFFFSDFFGFQFEQLVLCIDVSWLGRGNMQLAV